MLAIEDLKAKANIALEKQKQDAAERLDREKFETTLILKATEAASRQDQIRNLKFFLNAGFITDAEGKIAKMDEGAYPSLPPPVPEKALTAADVFNATRGSVALVTVEGNSKDTNAPTRDVGTLTVLTPSGYALMAKHLRDGFNPESIKLRANIASTNSVDIPLEIIKDDPDMDITLVKLKGSSGYSGIKLAKEQVLIGDEIYVLGFPVGFPGGPDLFLTIGRITSLNEQRGAIGIDVGVLPGLSGGPVLNRKGELIGILIGGREMPVTGIVEPVQFLKPMLEIAGL
jgi:S1-C subfamily serine protease